MWRNGAGSAVHHHGGLPVDHHHLTFRQDQRNVPDAAVEAMVLQRVTENRDTDQYLSEGRAVILFHVTPCDWHWKLDRFLGLGAKAYSADVAPKRDHKKKPRLTSFWSNTLHCKNIAAKPDTTLP